MRWIVIAACLILTASLAAETERPVVGDEVAIAVQNQKIYPMPAFYASPALPVAYGTVVTVTGVQVDWLEITVGGSDDGWVHSTAVTGAIQHSSGDASASGGVTTDEVMLAGRGFSMEMEETYSREHPELDFGPVDAMEEICSISPEELYAFLLSGGLIEGGEVSGGTGR